jgi:DNA-directed RNA polymerase subunit RPC12/RpoP
MVTHSSFPSPLDSHNGKGSQTSPFSVSSGPEFKSLHSEEVFHKFIALDILCPYCGSSNLVKDGFRRYETFDSQRYKCKDCRKGFGIKLNSNTKTPLEKPKPRPLPSIDSIVDVPCFSCSLNHCEPEYCQYLARYFDFPETFKRQSQIEYETQKRTYFGTRNFAEKYKEVERNE